MTYIDPYATGHNEYLNRYHVNYGNPTRVHTGASSSSSSSASANGVYASGISDAGLGKNTCTDGNDDGKIGIGSALLNAGEGIIKGAINGIKGMFTNKEGKFSLGKTLLSVGIAAACIAFPAVGAVACGIGAIAGGSQVIKGFKAQANATTDAEAKAAWENMGEGASTVVGCVLGAKASVGAMKGASTATKLSSLDDVGKFLGNTDDIAAALKSSNADDMIKALNSHGINNTDEVLKALDGVDNVDDALKAISSTGKTSALGAVDDSLKGTQKLTETAKAFGKDAMSSIKNNGKKAWNKVKEGLDAVDDYRDKNKNYKDASKKAEVAKAELDSADAAFKDVKDLSQIDDLTTRQNLASENYRNATAKQNQAQKELNGTKIQEIKNNIAQGKRNRVQAKQDIKDAKAKIKELDKTKVKDADINDLIGQRQTQVEKINNAKAQTPFGKLTTNVKGTKTYQYLKTTLKPDEAASAFKNIKNIKLKDVAGNLWGDGKKIFTALQENQNIQAVINEYGYDNVMQVLQVAYGYGLAEQTI